MKRRTTLVLSIFVTAILTSSARAEDVEKQVAKMNKRAMDDYDALEFESSRRTLLDAIEKLRANGLDETPLAAKTYLNLGIIYINGFKDRNRGQQQFVNALRIKPDIKIDPAVETPELSEAYQAAAKQAAKLGKVTPTAPAKPAEKPAEAPAETPPETPPPSGVKGLQHVPVDESRPNTPIVVRAQLGSDIPASKLFVFFRVAGQGDFISAPMKNTKADEWVGVIPADAVQGKSLQYYLEARDARGRAVANAGNAPEPFIVALNDNAPPPTNVPEVDVEDPLLKERLAKQRRAEEKKSTRDHVFIFVEPGFGFGVEGAGNHTEVAWQFQTMGPHAQSYVPQPVGTTGVVIAPFHLAAELGYLFNNHWAVSVLGRFQLVTGANAQTVGANVQAPTTKAFGAIAFLARARYRFLDGRFHPYVHVDIGGGDIRHMLDITSAESDAHPLVDAYTANSYNAGNKSVTLQSVCPPKTNPAAANPPTCTDTIALGYFLLGGGAGIWYDVASHFAVILDLNLLGAVGTGDHQSGLNIDVQAGVGVHFL
jgi:hypothetical protein